MSSKRLTEYWGMFVMREEPLQTSKFSITALNRKGSIMLSALMVGVIVTIMIAASSTYIRSRVLAVIGSSDKMDSRIALDGMLAYTINGIKHSWCFSNTWTEQGTCALTDPRNTARLLISDESLLYLDSSTTPRPSPTSATRISSIVQSVPLDNINSFHPLYNIARPLGGKFSTVTFTIKRDDSAIATTKGREVRLRVLVKLTAKSGAESDNLDLDSQIIVFPRELTYFGLILPRNLYLGAPASAAGDSGLNQVAVSGAAGLRFESPVFVNNNLVLPTSAVAMENVVFLDKVVLGGGYIYNGAALSVPKNAGGEGYMYNHEMKSFGGLLGGYELDDGKDVGLEYLFGIQEPPTPMSMTAYELCVARIQATYDLARTRNSQLYVKGTNLGGNVFRLSANIGNIDNLVEQSGPQTTFPSKVPGVPIGGVVDQYSSGIVFKARMVFAGIQVPGQPARGIYPIDFYLPRDGQVTLAPLGVAASPRIIIKTEGYLKNGNKQYNQVDLQVSFVNAAALDLGPYESTASSVPVQGSIKLLLEAFDYGYIGGNNIRDVSNSSVTHPTMGPYKANGFTFYKTNPTSSTMEIHSSSGTWSTNELLGDYAIYPNYEEPPADIDFNELDSACIEAPDDTSEAFYASFPSANWGTSFAEQSKHAWKFTPDTDFVAGYFDGTKIFDAGNARFDAGAGVYPIFQIKSVIKDCVVEATANFLTGFYTCETLTIRARTTPLRIIGTFIVGSLKIDNSAYSAGIRWSSIYSPQALYELRAARVLGKYKGTSGAMAPCDDPTLPPLWTPNLGVNSALIHYICNPVSLRTADPFKWTMVDPDCGIDPSVDPLKTACKSQPRRFLIKEISRTKGM